MWKLQFIFGKWYVLHLLFKSIFLIKYYWFLWNQSHLALLMKSQIITQLQPSGREREHRLPLTDACLGHGKQCPSQWPHETVHELKAHALQRERKQYRSIIGYNVHRPDGESRRMRVQVSTPIHCKTLQEQFTQKLKFIIHPPISNPCNFPLLYGFVMIGQYLAEIQLFEKTGIWGCKKI